MTKAEEIARETLFSNAACHRCHGKGTYSEFDGGTIYETDSDDEIADHYRTVRCPDCLKRVAAALEKVGAEERERCAKIAEGVPVQPPLPVLPLNAEEMRRVIAARIREGRDATQPPASCPDSGQSPDAPAAAK